MKDYVLRIKKSAKCVGSFSDSHFKGRLDTGKSINGDDIQISTNTVSWSSRKQHTVVLSTKIEAEYIGVANGAEGVAPVQSNVASHRCRSQH